MLRWILGFVTALILGFIDAGSCEAAAPTLVEAEEIARCYPGDGWPFLEAEPGEVKSFYVPKTDCSEIIVKIEAAEPPPRATTVFYFSLVFSGKKLDPNLAEIWVRAHSNLSAYPLRFRTPTLKITTGEERLLEVSSTSRDVSLNWGSSHVEGILTPMPIGDFLKLARADSAAGEALGLEFRLSYDELRSLEGLTVLLRKSSP